MRTYIRWFSTLVGTATAGLPLVAHADVPFIPTPLTPAAFGLSDTSPVVTVASLISAILGILGIVALILIIYAGFMWMFAQGNEEKVGTAVKILRDAFIGLLIIIASYGIASYVFSLINWAT